MPLTITTTDGVQLSEGDRAFNYYDYAVGVIARIETIPDGGSHWFDFVQDNGNSKTLNGERVCSIEYAVQRGMCDPEPVEAVEFCCPKHGVHQWEACGLCLAETAPKPLVSAELTAAVVELEDAARKVGEARNWVDRVTRMLPDAPITQGIALDELTQAGERLDRAISAYDLARVATHLR